MLRIEKLLRAVVILQNFISKEGQADDEEYGDDDSDGDDSDGDDIGENNGHDTDQVRTGNSIDNSRDELRRRITQMLWDRDNS